MCSVVPREGSHCCLAERRPRQSQKYLNTTKKASKWQRDVGTREVVNPQVLNKGWASLCTFLPCWTQPGKAHTGRMWHSESKSWVFSNPRWVPWWLGHPALSLRQRGKLGDRGIWHSQRNLENRETWKSHFRDTSNELSNSNLARGKGSDCRQEELIHGNSSRFLDKNSLIFADSLKFCFFLSIFPISCLRVLIDQSKFWILHTNKLVNQQNSP